MVSGDWQKFIPGALPGDLAKSGNPAFGVVVNMTENSTFQRSCEHWSEADVPKWIIFALLLQWITNISPMPSIGGAG